LPKESSAFFFSTTHSTNFSSPRDSTLTADLNLAEHMEELASMDIADLPFASCILTNDQHLKVAPNLSHLTMSYSESSNISEGIAVPPRNAEFVNTNSPSSTA